MGQQDDDRVIMVGASFEEIAVEAKKVAKVEFYEELERVQEQIMGSLTRAHESLLLATRSYKRQTKLLYLTFALCGIEAGCIVTLLLVLLRHI